MSSQKTLVSTSANFESGRWLILVDLASNSGETPNQNLLITATNAIDSVFQTKLSTREFHNRLITALNRPKDSKLTEVDVICELLSTQQFSLKRVDETDITVHVVDSTSLCTLKTCGAHVRQELSRIVFDLAGRLNSVQQELMSLRCSKGRQTADPASETLRSMGLQKKRAKTDPFEGQKRSAVNPNVRPRRKATGISYADAEDEDEKSND